MGTRRQRIDCQQLRFDPELGQERRSRASLVMTELVIKRMLCFALYLLGVERSQIAEVLSMPQGSLRTAVRALMADGIDALPDRRKRAAASARDAAPRDVPAPAVAIHAGDDAVVVEIAKARLTVPKDNPLCLRALVLMLLGSELMTTREAAQVLALTSQQVLNLARSLRTEDLAGLIPKKRGPRDDHVVTAEVKTEIIQQVAADLVTRGTYSSKAVAQELKERCDIEVPERTVRYHIARLGLSKLKRLLPELLATVKKTSD